jgi:hypothetical protein
MSLELKAGSGRAPSGKDAAPAAQRGAHDAPLEELGLRDWSGDCPAADRDRAIRALEGGKIVFLPALSFALAPEERRFLDPRGSDGKHKNISFEPLSGSVGGTSIAGDERDALAALLRRFAGDTRALLCGLFPEYAAHLQIGRTSLRPASIDNRRMSYRKDDRLLHVDAFPSQPVQGRRILRVFANVNADGAERVWRVGEPFADYARHLLPARQPYAPPGASALLAALKITKGRRTDYDRLMLSLHDRAKGDRAYQRDVTQTEIRFPAGSSWIVFTDLVAHAAIAGQHALEQTFFLPVAAMRDPAAAPLHVLERLTGRRLAG